MRRIRAAGAVLLMCTGVAFSQDKEQRKAIEKELESTYEMSKLATFASTKINKPGGVYVVQADGIQGEVMIQSGTVFTYVIDGKIRSTSDSGAGDFLSALMSGKKREEARILKKGERVYMTDFNAGGNGLRMDIVTVETFPIVDQGRTRQMAYKAALLFETAEKKFPAVADAAAMKALIDPFIVSEAQASAPKTIELGQSIEQVEAIFGKPVTIIKLGEKTIYTYKDIKVTFTNGKVTDVQ